MRFMMNRKAKEIGLGPYPELSLADARKTHFEARILIAEGKDTRKGRYLAEAYSSACRIFTNVVGPDDNKAHRDHFHLDTGIGVGCLPDWAKKIKKLAYRALREVI